MFSLLDQGTSLGEDDVEEEEEAFEIEKGKGDPFIEGEEVHLRLDVVGRPVFLRPIQTRPVLQLRIEEGEEEKEASLPGH